ncbi:hypothetical protein HYC85_008280 [Camellia sinensis]|uniref:protein-serine/threonine phosphatase n=1 Tax=Camellia sinensis TaxID=4442 RepID=A0A7J7HTN6_CAMSI|nr:hypothetical protein HYC85_008280 [Camellia sinensis]
MYKSVVYEGDKLLGEVEVYPQNQNQNQDQNGVVFDKEIRISHFSQPSERCPPLAVLHTITSNGVCFKMESKSHSQDSPLYFLHSSCSRENKTAVMLLGGEELHLVAMASRKNDGRCLCFWGFNVALGLYNSCLVMLNLRCLGIVFDLDETLIVANTMRSFEDRIEALQRKISTEADQQRISGMLAEVKRYQDDKIILKQYAENDQVVENGKVINSQSEVVPALSDNYQPIVRPLIRLQDKNIILTRINPQIRDTSVLVRLRPAWEDLRSYLTARGSRKSLFNVFQDGICHPKMALVIDDRLKVWDEKDQPRANNVVPVLCVARNVACNVRGGFFREFDDGLLQRIPEVMYEDDIKDIPSVPDVSNYLMSEDDPSTLNANKDPLAFDGMADAEVERRLKDAISASSAVPSAVTNLDPRLAPLQYTVASSAISIPPSTFQGPSMPFPGKQLPQLTSVVKPLSQVAPPEAGLQSSPAREEGEVPESELDPDTRRRLLILQHGQDTRDHGLNEPQFPVRPPAQVSVPRMQPRGSWFPVDEEMSPRLLNQVAAPKEFPLNSDSMHIEKHRIHHPPFLHKLESSIPSDRVLENQRLPKEAFQREDQLRMNHSLSSYHSFSGEEVPLGRSSSSSRELDVEPGRVDPYTETPIGALQDIAIKCGTKAEFRSGLVSSTELQFSAEVVLFAGEKIGEGNGRTRREAQRQAAEGSLMNLADKYLSRLKPDSSSVHGEGSRYSNANANGYVNDGSSFGYQPFLKEESPSFSSASEPPRVLDPRLVGSKKSMGSVSPLSEFADEKALGSLKSTFGQFSQKRQGSPRALQGMSNKRFKPEYPRVLQRMPSSARYPKNASSVP